jgi:hypothetical protein
LLLCTEFIRGRKTERSQETIERNFGNPGWQTERLVIVSQGLSVFQAGFIECK